MPIWLFSEDKKILSKQTVMQQNFKRMGLLLHRAFKVNTHFWQPHICAVNQALVGIVNVRQEVDNSNFLNSLGNAQKNQDPF